MLRCSILSGLMLAFVATASFAQFFGGGGGAGGLGGMRMPAGMLLTMPEVLRELNVTDAQKTQMEEIRGEVQKDIQSAVSGIDFQALRDMSQEDRDKKIAELRTMAEGLSKKIDAKVEKVLDEKQMARLKQLQIQREGAAAFTRPEVVTKLALTDDQKAKIKKIQDDARPQGRAAFNRNASPEERQAAISKMQQSRAKVLKDIMDVLNDDQLLAWTELTGKEFKFPQGMGMGGFGRGILQPNPPTN
jgi:Spy/CpxP family protein refolding chaperone